MHEEQFDTTKGLTSNDSWSGKFKKNSSVIETWIRKVWDNLDP